MAKLLSDKVKKLSGSELSPDRYDFLRLAEAEPDFGLPSANNGIMSSLTDGTRDWLYVGAGLDISSNNIIVEVNTAIIDSSNLIFSSANTLYKVIEDLDANLNSAVSGSLTSVTSDSTLSGNGTAASPLSVVDNGHNHTSSNISDFSESVDDRVNALLQAGTDITLTYDDVANTLTVAANTAAGNINDLDEAIDDRVNALLVAGSNISITYDDAANTLTISSSGTGGFDLSNNTTDDLVEGNTNLYYTETRANTAIDSRVTQTFVNNLNITAAGVQANSITLGTDTTGNYVATIAGTANEIEITGSGSETAAVTIGLPNDVTIGNNLTVTGNLIVNGTTTTVNSTTVTIDDPIFTLGGDAAPTIDDNKDRGNEFRWHNGASAKVGFFGFDDSTGKFTFIPDAINTSEVFSGTTGELDAKVDWSNLLNIPSGSGIDTTYSISSETGAGGANLRLTGSDLSTDDVLIAGGTNVTVTRTDANTITISSTDTNTTYTAGTGLTLSGTTFNANVEGTTQTTVANAVTTNALRTYAIQVDGSDNLVVNIPWSDTDTTYSSGNGIDLSGTTFSVAAGTGLTQEASGLAHSDTSTQASLTALTGANVVSDIDLDGFGHVTNLSTRSLDVRDLNNTDTLVASLRAHANITGGGTITFNSSGYIKNSTRFIVISNGRGSHFSTTGFFDINIPISGTITGVGGAANKTATADGVPLDIWEALYYILPIGSGSTSLAANFRVVDYTSDVLIPDNWVLIALRNGDTGQKGYVIGKYALELGESIDTTLYDAKRAENADTLDGLDSLAFATAAQGTLADSALQSSDIGVTIQGYSAILAGTTASYTTEEETKLSGIETGADVTDAVNVEPLVDAHLNTGTANTDQILAWTGADYDWIDVSGGITWTRKTTNYSAVANEGIIADTSGGAFIITLPSTPVTGDTIIIADGADWSTINLTVARNGSTIEGLAEDLVIDLGGIQVQLIYDGTTWEVYPLGTPASSYTVADDTTTNATVYPIWNSVSTGAFAPKSSSTKLYYNPLTGTLNSTDFNSLSDESLKENISTIEVDYNIINNLRGVEFNWKDTKKKAYGFIAQEVEEILPELISENSDTSYKSVSYIQIIPHLLEAVKDLKQEVERLREEVNGITK